MSADPKLTIAIAERPLAGSPPVHHLALFLMDANEPYDILQRLHFSGKEGDDRMRAWAKGQMTLQRAQNERSYEVRPYISGDMVTILKRWNHILKYGVHVNRQDNIRVDSGFKRDFTPERLNCRAAVAAALNAAGLKLSRGYTVEEFGMACKRMPLGAHFSAETHSKDTMHEVFADWRALSDNLPAPPKYSVVAPYILDQDWLG